MSGLGAEYPNMAGWNGYPSLTPPGVVSSIAFLASNILCKTLCKHYVKQSIKP